MSSSAVQQGENLFTTVKSTDSQPTEVIIALVGALGVDHTKLRGLICERLQAYDYRSYEIRISSDIIADLLGIDESSLSKYERSEKLIGGGNFIRKHSNTEVLATAAAAKVAGMRGSDSDDPQRIAYVISSLKHPDEVAELRRIYGPGFFLFAVHKSKERRAEFLKQNRGMTDQEAEDLIRVDEDQDDDHGQHMRDTFHLADFFIHDDDSEDKLRYSIERCLDLVFGKPDITPTFNEFAMYMAFSSALRSADLSRQVGAVIAKDKQIISSGANDCPAFNGGLYWPVFSSRKRIEDVPGGRDIVRPWPDGVEGEGVGYDSNAYEKQVIIEKVLDLLGFSGDDAAKAKLESSPISDITEYGRVVHAEMEAILSCARIGVSCVGGTIYCTTFPCHNCAKHIIASGISEVVFVEPYPKSKALEFHPDSAVLEKKEEGKVRFKPFVGVGPRRFFDLFSMSWGDGRKMKRKIGGFAVNWDSRKAMPRLMMRPDSYRALEKIAIDFVTETKERIEEGSKED